MKEIHTSIEIAAPAESVWQVLTDFEAYPQWSPFIRRVEGKLAVGEMLEFAVATGPDTTRGAKARVLGIEPNRALSWGGGLPLGLFRGEHSFIIEPAGVSVVLHDIERFYGPLVRFLIRRERMTGQRRAFELFDAALRKRVESFAEKAS